MFKPPKMPKEFWDLMGFAGTIGLHLVSSTFVGLAIGWFLDRWLDTKPWWTMIFLGIGIAAGFKNVYEEARRIQKQDAKDQAGKSAGDAKKPHPED